MIRIIEGVVDMWGFTKLYRSVAFSLAIMLLMLFQGCAIKDVRIEDAISELKPELSSYSWIPEAQKQPDPLLETKHLDDYIKSVVDSDLAKKGYTKVPLEDGPTFWATYDVAVQDVTKSVRLRDLQRFNRYKTDVYDVDYQKVTLTLDFSCIDKPTLYWRGSAVAMGHTYDPPQKRNQRIAQAAQRIMQRFPAATCTTTAPTKENPTRKNCPCSKSRSF